MDGQGNKRRLLIFSADYNKSTQILRYFLAIFSIWKFMWRYISHCQTEDKKNSSII